jgi:arginyl-tRNA synthetase
VAPRERTRGHAARCGALLLEHGVARADLGAICVFFDDDPELGQNKTPFIVRTMDGALLCSTSYIAAVLYRRDRLGTERAIPSNSSLPPCADRRED